MAGRYRIGALLGEGGMAHVYRAVDEELGRDVALKLLRPGVGDESFRARFTAEARTLAVLSHPHLVTLLDAGLEESRPWLVMELVDGPTLRALIATGPIEGPRLAGLLAGVAEALDHAHSKGIVHRDVKPANVLVAQGDHARLADFGIASDGTAELTRAGESIGSPAYLAPEQLTGGAVTGAADVYALGLVAIEGLTGERVFSGSGVEVAFARLTADPEVPEGLGASWRTLLTLMTRRDPQFRPTAAEVAARLRLIAAAGVADLVNETTAPILGVAASRPIAPVVAPARRKHLVPVLVVAATVALLAGLVVAPIALRGDREPSQQQLLEETAPTPTRTSARPSPTPSTTAPVVLRTATAKAPAPKPRPHSTKGKAKPKGKKGGKRR